MVVGDLVILYLGLKYIPLLPFSVLIFFNINIMNYVFSKQDKI